MKKRSQVLETVVHGVFLLLGLITVGCVLLISVYLIVSGIPAIRKIGLVPFLFGKTWASTAAEPSYGILPFILTSVYGTAGAIVLDVMLPGVDGIELLQRMKASAELRTIPVVMATAKGAEYDRIRGLDLGADYYLTKPFGVMELVSCVKAVLRRCGTKTAAQLRCGGLVLDEESHTVTADGENVALTYKEFELLRLFLSHPGTAFSRDQLMADVWGTDYCGETRTVDMHIRTLRQKLGAYGEKIETVRGVGYRMEGKT